MANDCKPRSLVTPVTEPTLPLPGSCMEAVPAPAPECMEAIVAPGAECCPDDAEERGWYNDPVRSPCERVVVPYGTYHSEVSQEEADLLADTAAYETLDIPVPVWESLPPREMINPSVDIYGTLGPEEIRSGGPCDTVCDQVAFCDGPVAEGVPMVDQTDRYNTRWQAKVEEGYLFYRREGEPWIAVSNDLVPQPNLNLTGLGFCFDANARPCFCSQLGATIHIWRYQAGVPFEHIFSGTGAKLFFNGVLQRDNSIRDVVCYFCEGGSLCASFQRENFAITHTLYTPSSGDLTRVYLVDRGNTVLDKERFYIGVGNDCGILRTALYQPWPFAANEFGDQAISVDGIEYFAATLDLGTYIDEPISGFSIDGIEYLNLTVDISQDSEYKNLAISIDGITYAPNTIILGTYTEPVTSGVTVETIAYPNVSTNVGSYTEPETQAIAIEGIKYASA